MNPNYLSQVFTSTADDQSNHAGQKAMQLIELNHNPDRQMTGEFARQSFDVLKKPSPTKSVQSMNYRLSGA